MYRKSYLNVIEILQLDKSLHELLKLFNVIKLGRKQAFEIVKNTFLLLSVLNKPKKRRHASGEDGEEGEEAGEDEATASDTENDQNVDNRSGH